MNIFILSDKTDFDQHVAESAHMHCDQHVIKMINESVQLLVTALHVKPWHTVVKHAPPCKPLGLSMQQHPCAIWVASDIHNYMYVNALGIALCDEFRIRYSGRPHVYESWLRDSFGTLKGILRPMMPDDFVLAMKVPELKGKRRPLNKACLAYRDYYAVDKHTFATWKHGEIPSWFSKRLSGEIPLTVFERPKTWRRE